MELGTCPTLGCQGTLDRESRPVPGVAEVDSGEPLLMKLATLAMATCGLGFGIFLAWHFLAPCLRVRAGINSPVWGVKPPAW